MHVDTDLSAYLDRELSPAEQARVHAHLGTCRRCAARLAELRGTASLVSALTGPRPSRSLAPRVVERWNWLRPIRSLATVASGAFLFLFLITAVAQSGSNLGGGPAAPFGGPGAAPAAAPAPATLASPARQEAAQQEPAALPQAAATATADAAQRATTGATSDPAKVAGASPTAAATAGAPGAEDTAYATGPERTTLGQPAAPPNPLLWLGLAITMAIAAGIAHWRLRTA